MKRVLPAPTTADRGLVLLVAALSSGLIVAATLTALWLRTSADDMAAAAFADAGHQATQLQVGYIGVRAESVDDDAADEVAAAVPDTLRSVLTEPRHAVTTTQMVPTVLPRRPGEPAYLAVGAVADVESAVEVVEGRRPDPGDPVRALPPAVAAEYDGPTETGVVEVMLEESAAVELDMPVGSWVALSGQSYFPRNDRPATLHVVGTFRAADPYPSPVDDLDAVRRPFVSDTPEFNLVRATALAADESTVLAARWEEQPDVRFSFDLDGAPDASTTTTLVEETRRATLQTWPSLLGTTTVDAATGLGPIAEAAVEQRATSNGLVSLLLTALAASGLTVLLAAAVVLTGRRRRVTEVMRARGAGPRRVALLRGSEALLLTGPGVAAAVALAAWLSPDGLGVRDLLVPLVAAVVTGTLVTTAQTVRSPVEPLRLVLRDAVQLGVVLLAAIAVLLVVTRDSPRPDDPVMLLIAPLVGAGAAVVLLRLLQGGLAAVRSLTRRTRAATALVGLSQAAAVARQVILPATALVLAASAGVLAVSVADSLRAGAEQAGWEQIGADLSVTSHGMDDDVIAQLEDLPRVTAVAEVFTADSVSLETRGGVEGVTVIGVDASELARVGGDALGGLALPAADDGVLAAVATPDLQLADSMASVRYAQAQVPVRVVERLDRIPGVTDGGSFVLVDRAELAAATDRPLDLYSHVLISGTPDRAAVTRLARTRDPRSLVLARSDVAEEALSGPVVDRTLTLTRVATVASLVLTLVAVLLTAGLAAPVRRRAAAVLAVLGGSDREARRAGVLGLLPVVATACLAAALCGVVLSAVAGRGVDLTTLTGTMASLPVRPSATSTAVIAAVLGGLVLLAAVAVRPRRTTVPSDPEAS